MMLRVGLITRSCEYEGATINNNKKLSFFSLLGSGVNVPIRLWVGEVDRKARVMSFVHCIALHFGDFSICMGLSFAR